MSFVRRLVWWKCLFWVVVGVGVGALVAARLPEPGPPAGGVRLPVDRLVVALSDDKATGDVVPPALPPGVRLGGDTFPDAKITNVVLYPTHGQVQLLTFDYRTARKTAAGYAFANAPMLTVRDLQNRIDADPATRAPRPPSAEPTAASVPELEHANRALAVMAARPDHQWPTAAAFLDDLHARRPAFTYGRAWWTGDRWRWGVPVAAGAALVGLIGSLLTRRSAADLAAADLLAGTRVRPATTPTPSIGRDMSEVEALDAVLAARLAGQTADDETDVGPAPAATDAPTQVIRLDDSPVTATPAAEEQKKDYAGEFYPTVRRAQPKGFSLVELLVSIGVIGILIALLLPAVFGVRRSADTVLCATNLRGIGQGMAIYLLQNQNTFPPAYLYIGHRIENGVQTPTSPSAGYIHWSSYLYGTGGVAKSAFTCPAMQRGGLPPTNTPADNRNPGQVCPSDSVMAVVDEQAPRLAYTVNEVLCPRNKFVARSFGGSRVYRFVKATEVANASGTILGTEMIDNSAMISYDDGGTGWIMSHRPVMGFVGLNGELDMYTLPVGDKFRPASAADLDADPNSLGLATHTRLDLVGRNHGAKKGYPDRRLSNFLYVDGHVESKSVYDTVTPAFEWGARFYSLTPNDDQISP